MNEGGAVHAGETGGFFELGAVEERIDDDDIGAGFSEASLATRRVRGGDHDEGTLFMTRSFVSFEISPGKRESIITHEEEFHEGIRREVVVILENDIIRADPFRQELRGGEGLHRSIGLLCGEKRSSVIGRSARDGIGEEDDAEGCDDRERERSARLPWESLEEYRHEKDAHGGEKGEGKDDIAPDAIRRDIEKDEARSHGHDEEDGGPAEEQPGGFPYRSGEKREENESDDAECGSRFAACREDFREGQSDAGGFRRGTDGGTDRMRFDVGRHRDDEKEEDAGDRDAEGEWMAEHVCPFRKERPYRTEVEQGDRENAPGENKEEDER